VEAKGRTACDATLAMAEGEREREREREGRMLSVLKLRSYVAMAGAVIGAAASIRRAPKLANRGNSFQTYYMKVIQR
jgi:hypothetical protein